MLGRSDLLPHGFLEVGRCVKVLRHRDASSARLSHTSLKSFLELVSRHRSCFLRRGYKSPAVCADLRTSAHEHVPISRASSPSRCRDSY